MGMLFFKKKPIKKEVEVKRTNSFGESLEKLDKDGNLPWGWYAAHREFTAEREAEFHYFLDNYIKARSGAPLEKYGALKSLVMYLVDSKSKCESMGECYARWFEGAIAGNEYIDKLKAELAELESNLHRTQTDWEKRQNTLEGLEEKVWQTIKDNDGILQADLVKMFDECVKHDISALLYHWDKEGAIERVKSGRSYALHIKNKGQN